MGSHPAGLWCSQLLVLACRPEANGGNTDGSRSKRVNPEPAETRGRWRVRGAGMAGGRPYGSRMGRGPGWTGAGKQRDTSGADGTAEDWGGWGQGHRFQCDY